MDGVVFFCLGIWARKFWSAFSGSRFRPPQVFWNLAHREVFQHVYMFKQKLKFKEYPYKVYFQFAAVWAGYFAFRMERCRCPRSNLTWSRPRGSWVCHVLTILTHQIMRQRSTERWDNETTLKERLVHVGERNLGGSLARVNAASATFFGKVQSQHLWDNGAACLQRPGKFFDWSLGAVFWYMNGILSLCQYVHLQSFMIQSSI